LPLNGRRDLVKQYRAGHAKLVLTRHAIKIAQIFIFAISAYDEIM